MGLSDHSILITGGSGSFGQAFSRYALAQGARRVAILSRDELKQAEMAAAIGDDRMRYFLGDVRDAERVALAMRGCEIVIHAAAIKRIEKAEYDPLEACKTNIDGTANVIRAAIQTMPERVVLLSTDKACNPITHYGVTKACAERLMLAGNAYLGSADPRFSVVRYGNVAGSRGSVIPLWRRQVTEDKPLGIYNKRMTRFWITLPEIMEFVDEVLKMPGGYCHVPIFMPAYNVVDLARAVAGDDWPLVELPPRALEKVHEELVAAHEDRVLGPIGPYDSSMARRMTIEELRLTLEAL